MNFLKAASRSGSRTLVCNRSKMSFSNLASLVGEITRTCSLVYACWSIRAASWVILALACDDPLTREPPVDRKADWNHLCWLAENFLATLASISFAANRSVFAPIGSSLRSLARPRP